MKTTFVNAQHPKLEAPQVEPLSAKTFEYSNFTLEQARKEEDEYISLSR